MSTWYLLPCPCGKSIRIQPRHAGESRSCECGTELEVPTLREIRRLETMVEEVTDTATSQAKSQQRYWHPALGALFGIGTMMMLIGLGLTAWNMWRSMEIPEHMMAKPTHEQVIAAAPSEIFRIDIDKLNLLDSVEKIWEPLSKYEELPERAQPGHLFLRGIRDSFRRTSLWSAVVAACGLVLAVIPFFFSKGKR